MASGSQSSLHMRSRDLIKKEPIDYGGFGEVYLCYHVTYGQVVLKTMYTGPLRNEERKRSLLEEGKIMASLNHERVVKLLGVIMEDRDCSLVMELLPRGNLLDMLKTVSVPISVKGRIILEILEGMVYLTKNRVIHKDIKPENILVDKDFHIKIADLGLATYQTWSRLTKEESRRKSHSGQSAGMRGAGTLSYMAPEHLDSIHTRSSEKSDVYSFAIVVWVILTRQEPYESARSEDQMSQCVRNGDRPSLELVPKNTPAEIIQLMKRCWDQNPELRPAFQEAYNSFRPFYLEKLQPHVENDLYNLTKEYAGPDELVEKMELLSMTQESLQQSEHDSPAPLISSDRSVAMPVEASIEDLHNEQLDDMIQTDARCSGDRSELEEKLDQELQYHKHGSYNCNIQSAAANSYRNNIVNPLLQSNICAPNPSHTHIRSSVLSWTNPEPVQPVSQEEELKPPSSRMCDPTYPSSFTPHLHSSSSMSSLPQSTQPPQHFPRQQSWPTNPVPDFPAQDINSFANASKSGMPQDPGSLYIQNASGIQIGNNNSISIRGHETNPYSLCPFSNSSIQEGILKYEDYTVTEEHLDLLRDNIGNKWKRCARGLGLTGVEIETIEHDYQRDGLPEMVHQMLERWKMKEGFTGRTIGKLCKALERNVEVDIIQGILDMCSSSHKA